MLMFGIYAVYVSFSTIDWIATAPNCPLLAQDLSLDLLDEKRQVRPGEA